MEFTLVDTEMVELVLLDEDGGVETMSNEKYTVTEVATHNSADDCWVIIHEKIYDVTKYLDEHPGGDQVLLVTAGGDATEEFDDAGHSTDAWTLMEKYLVGQVDLAPLKAEESSQFSCKTLVPTIASVLMVGLVAGAYLWRRKRIS